MLLFILTIISIAVIFATAKNPQVICTMGVMFASIVSLGCLFSFIGGIGLGVILILCSFPLICKCFK